MPGYNNFYGYQPNVDRINRQIEDLTNMRNQMMQPQQPMQQAPINNIINTNSTKVDLEAKILSDGQTVNDVIVQNRTVFIDEKNKKVSIKELDGTISKEYEIIIPLTAEQKEIQELKQNNYILMNKLKEMEMKLNDNEFTIFNEYSKSNENVEQSNAINNGNDTTKSKRTSKSNNE